MNLILNNHIIDSNLNDILLKLKFESDSRYLKTIRPTGENIAITCPFHKDGQENHPSCFVYARTDDPTVPFGFYKCFTCHEQGQLYKLVAKCLGCSYDDAIQWLIDNFSTTFNIRDLGLTDIVLEKEQEQYLNEAILNEYSYLHPYMFKRGLKEDIIKKFKVGWNEKTNAITFPVWDEHGRLVGITERSVTSKNFYIPEGLKKPVYLLNEIIRENITEIYVVESQIDALYLWGFGYPAVALFGTGSKQAYEVLKKSGVRVFHLCFDGDLAGRHGAIKFIQNMPNDVIIDIIQLPEGKDVNDLTKEQFEALPHFDKYNF